MPEPLPIRRILEDKGEEFQLRCIGGERGLDRALKGPELNRPSLALAGFTDFFSWDRAQIIGVTELRYLDCLTPEVAGERLRKMFEYAMPCVILTTNEEGPPPFRECAEDQGVPLLVTRRNTSHLYSVISPYLDMHFAPSKRVHGNLVDVFGMGVLITGLSGVGKSECALELVERGHRLVADDIVNIKRPSGEALIGLSNNVLQHHIEVRGLGIMNVETLFGVGAVRPQMEIDLIIRLEKYDPEKIYNRSGLDIKGTNVLGVMVPEYVIPVKPGRNIAILAEVAALNQRLTNSGRNPAKKFQEHMAEVISGQSIRPSGMRTRPRMIAGTPSDIGDDSLYSAQQESSTMMEGDASMESGGPFKSIPPHLQSWKSEPPRQ